MASCQRRTSKLLKPCVSLKSTSHASSSQKIQLPGTHSQTWLACMHAGAKTRWWEFWNLCLSCMAQTFTHGPDCHAWRRWEINHGPCCLWLCIQMLWPMRTVIEIPAAAIRLHSTFRSCAWLCGTWCVPHQAHPPTTRGQSGLSGDCPLYLEHSRKH